MKNILTIIGVLFFSSAAYAYSPTTGTGLTVLNNGPSLIAPALGTPASGNLANETGYLWANIVGGTNTTAALVIGTGGSLAASGSGTITATAVPASGLTGATLASSVTASSIPCAGLSNGATGCSTATGTSGATIPLNNGSNTLSGANSVTGVMTFTNSDWRMLGSSTGYTALTSDNAGSSNFTLHVPAANDTLADLAGTQTFTGKTYDTAGSGNTFKINGIGRDSAFSQVSTHCVNIDASGNLKDSGSTCGGGGVNPVLLPSSTYTADTAGNLFPYVYTGAGGNASASEAGWGVAASLGADTVLQMRFQMPPSIPGSGTFKLVSYCQANATSGVVKYTVSDADVAAGSNPSGATLTGETQTSITWSAVDIYVVTKTSLSSTPLADDVSVVAVTFNHTSWTLAQIMSCRWSEIWE